MLYLVWMVVLTVLAALLSIARRNLPAIDRTGRSRLLSLVGSPAPAAVLVVALMAFSTFDASVHQVPAGHIGVIYEFGGIKRQIAEGLQFVASWRNVMIANIQVQRRVFDKLNAFSEESQDVFVRVQPERSRFS